LQHYRPGMPWAGVLANRVASERHASMLQDSVREPSQWMGAVMLNTTMTLPERHLGLTVASEVVDAMDRLDVAADALADTPLGQLTLVDLQRWSVEFAGSLVESEGAVAGCAAPCPPPAMRPPPLPAQDTLPSNPPVLLWGKRIAVARDAAFCFIYAANLDTLKALGAELVFFSPLTDNVVPSCDALWIPGGYPELHVATIAANSELRDSLAAHIAAGKPVWAECGGMMSLFETLVTVDGQRHVQWGLLPGEVTMHKRLAGLGPQQLRLSSGTLRGHTFHYSTTQTTLQTTLRTARPDSDPMPDAGEAVWQQGAVRASYFHAWFPSCPSAVVELFSRESA
jgi:cobyrinic acid a,c-diamide synthase